MMHSTRDNKHPARSDRMLFFGFRAPPHFGPATTCEALVDSSFGQDYELTFVDLNISRDFSEVGRMNVGKAFRTLKRYIETIGYLTSRDFDVACYPPAFSKGSFLKDSLFIWTCLLFGVPVVLHAHGNNLVDFHKTSSPILKWIIERTITCSKAAIVFGERLKFNFDSFLPADRIFAVHAGIKPSEVAAIRKPEDGKVRVLFLSNLIESKGFWTALNAVESVSRAIPDVEFLFAGAWERPEDETKARALLAEQGAKDVVSFLGTVHGSPKVDLLGSCDILIFPTHHYFETFGMVNLEALEAGLPIITTSRGAIPEVVIDGENGFLIPEKDPEALAERIIHLASDSGLRNQMGSANRERFARSYTHDAFGERMIHVFETVARLK
jgi:glycosyltransferase involved in cell wall biosynthesis